MLHAARIAAEQCKIAWRVEKIACCACSGLPNRVCLYRLRRFSLRARFCYPISATACPQPVCVPYQRQKGSVLVRSCEQQGSSRHLKRAAARIGPERWMSSLEELTSAGRDVHSIQPSYCQQAAGRHGGPRRGQNVRAGWSLVNGSHGSYKPCCRRFGHTVRQSCDAAVSILAFGCVQHLWNGESGLVGVHDSVSWCVIHLKGSMASWSLHQHRGRTKCAS